MTTIHKALAGIFAATAVMSGPGLAQTARYESRPLYAQASPATVGTIDAIEVVDGGARRDNKVAGTILGGVIGGVLGHQIGSGRGNDAATVAGAIGGAAVGHEIAENRSGAAGYRVNVRMDNGDYRTFYQDNVSGLAVGDRVEIDNGRLYRYASGTYRYEDRGYRSSGYDTGPYTPQYQPYQPADTAQYQAYTAPPVRYLRDGRVDRRVYHYDSVGFRVDQFGNRYDAEGYWVDERNNRYEYQDPPMNDDVPNRLNHPQ